MKKHFYLYLIMLFIFLPITVKAENSLSCSINGTGLLYIPGALTTEKQFRRSNSKFATSTFKFDSKLQNVFSLQLETNGLYNDKINYFLNTFSDPFYKKNAFYFLTMIESGVEAVEYISDTTSVFKTVRKINKRGLKTNVKEIFQNKTASNRFLNAVFEKYINYEIDNYKDPRLVMNAVSLLYYGESLTKALNVDNEIGSIYSENARNKEAVKEAVTNLLDQNKKIIVSAHGEGGQLVRNAFNELRLDIRYNTKISNYTAVLATSPTTQSFHSKYKYLKNNLDHRFFGGALVSPNFTFDNYRVDTSIASLSGLKNALTNIFNTGASDYVEDYLNEDKIGSFKFLTHDQNNNLIEGVEQTTPFKAFSDEVYRVAELLEDNCGPVVLYSSDFSNSGEMTPTYNVNGFTNEDRTISAILSRYIDENKDGINDYVDQGETLYKWEVRSDSYDTDEVIRGEGKNLNFPIPYSGKYNVTVFLYKKSNNQLFTQTTFDVAVPDKAPKIMSVAYYCKGEYDASTQVTILVDDPDTKIGSLWLQTYYQQDVGGEIVLQPGFREAKYTMQANGIQTAFLTFSGRGFDFYYKPPSSDEYVLIHNQMLPSDMYCFMTK